MTRRSALLMSSSLAFAPLAKSLPAAPAGRLKQSAARWCYSKIAMDDLCRGAAEIGLSGIDLVDEKDWPTCRKYGLVPAIVSGAGTIPVAWNRQENHDKLEKEMRDNIAKAAAAKVPKAKLSKAMTLGSNAGFAGAAGAAGVLATAANCALASASSAAAPTAS